MRIVVAVLVFLLLCSITPASRGQSEPAAPAASRPFDPIAWWANVDPSLAEVGVRHWLRIESGLNRVAKEHPDLATRAKSLGEKAESMYGAAAGVIDVHFARVHAPWREDIEDWKQHLAKLASPSDPKEFLTEVERGLSGEASGEEDAVLLAFSPRYAERPEAEIADGLVSTLSTRGLELAKGVEISLTLPRSWMYKDPAGHAVAVVRRSHAGAGDAVLQLIINDVPADEMRQINEQGGAKFMAAPDAITQAGGRVLETGACTLGKDEAAWTRYLLTEEGESGAAKVLVWSLHSFHAGKYVNLQFQVVCLGKTASELASDEAMKVRLEHYRPLFEKIVESAAYAKPGE